MPHLACRTCGRRIYSVAPLSSMTADELRCPRCGAYFQEDRRVSERRTTVRRENPPMDPGPPAAAEDDAKPTEGATGDGTERRGTNRRTTQRRGGKPPLPGAAEDNGGWRD